VIAQGVLAAIFAWAAFDVYRNGAFINMQFRRKTREEAPVQFWAGVAALSCASLACMLLAVRDMLRA